VGAVVTYQDKVLLVLRQPPAKDMGYSGRQRPPGKPFKLLPNSAEETGLMLKPVGDLPLTLS
jgi:hypothetical protein